MTTFGLVHGAWHSSWWWGPVEALLRERGHATVAMDLPGDDDGVTFSGYAQIVAEALAGAGDDVVLVASSLGGQTAPLVPALRPVREIVLVGALLAVPGKSFNESFDSGETWLVPGAMKGVGHDEQGRSVWVDDDELVRVLYHDVDPALTAEAFPRLRPQSRTPYVEPCPLDAWPDVPVRYVVCTEDRIVPLDYSRAAAARLGIETIEIGGGHMPMLARPADLADVLVADAR